MIDLKRLNEHLEKQAARLALLEKFARRVRLADESETVPTAEMLLAEAVAWLDDETKKAGE